MNIKVRPNKKAQAYGFINYTQNLGKKNKIKQEKGITLIALIVTVILLVILARSCSKRDNRG